MRNRAFHPLCVLSVTLLVLGLAGCSVNNANSVPTPTPEPTPAPAPTPATATNQVALIAHTPNSGYNRFTVTVTVCVPGTTNCQDVPNILVDTGSTGLRIQASALQSGFALPSRTYTPDGGQLAECEIFGGGNAWGMINLADIKIGGTTASNIAVHVIGADSKRQPAECPSGGATSNGTLGIGINETDCNGSCTQPAYYGSVIGYRHKFFSCTNDTCTGLTGSIDAAWQLRNPVALLDGGIYNGAVLDLPAIPGDVGSQVTGSLIFGVNVNTLSEMSNPTVVALSSSGTVTTTFEGVTYPKSYFDSGTQSYSIGSTSFTPCNPLKPMGLFCVNPTISTQATIAGLDNVPHTVAFKVGVFPSTGISAVAADFGDATPNFVWGAPFFFGKRVAVVRSGQKVNGMDVVGPLYAWQTASAGQTGN